MATIDMGLKEGGGAVPLSRSAGNTSNAMWPAPRSNSVPSGFSSIEPFGHNSVGCHSPRRNTSTNYYLVVQIHTVTVRSDDARYQSINQFILTFKNFRNRQC